MDLFCFWSLTIFCFTCMESSFDCMMWVPSSSFQMQIAHLEPTSIHPSIHPSIHSLIVLLFRTLFQQALFVSFELCGNDFECISFFNYLILTITINLTFVRFYGLDIWATPGSSVLSPSSCSRGIHTGQGLGSLAAWESRSPKYLPNAARVPEEERLRLRM